jgi:sulfatase modifying factor 1
MASRERFLRLLVVTAGLVLLAAPASAVSIDWVFVGDPGNAPDTRGRCVILAASCGPVSYEYYISKYEVTNAQYAEFLNLKASSDPLGLYNENMSASAQGGITRSGSSGSYTYAVKTGFADKPVTYTSFYDALRFTNWLNNGQGAGDTENGAYTLIGGTAIPSNGLTVTRNPGAIVFLPSENEWYKAAYYDGLSATYFDYPTGTNTAPTCALPGATPNTANCGAVLDNGTDVGSYTGSASPYGTFDQAGNLSEWNEQIVEGVVFWRGVRGGDWNDASSSGSWSLAPGIGIPASEGARIGFRVASLVPEPGTALLLMTGLAGLAARQERRKRTL